MEQEDLPDLLQDETDEDSEDNDDECENEMRPETTTCLFCTLAFPSVEETMEHIRLYHGVDFALLKSRFQMDQYSFIKLINCIRSRDDITAEKLASAEESFWNDEKYLKPKEYETWLTYDFDELPSADPTTKLLREPKELEEKVQELTVMLADAATDIARLRLGFRRLFDEDSSKTAVSEKSLNGFVAASLHVDESYFSSYAHFSIHHEMLSDVVRTTSYRDALLLNKAFVNGKDVLDLGCGTAILSIFASQAGAKTVLGIDNSDIIWNAMDIVRINKAQNVTLVKGRVEETAMQQKFDIIISEWMGYFLLFEGMLDSVIYARDNLLKQGGLLMPSRCTMSILGYGSDELFNTHVAFWDDVYGLDMSNMRKAIKHEPLIDIVDAQHILTDAITIADFDLATVDLNYSNFTYDFNLNCSKAGNLSAFVGYFDTFFDLPHPVSFSTSPRDKPTHWKQVVFFIEQPQTLRPGEKIPCKISCKRSIVDARSLDIIIEAFGKEFKYYLN